MNKALIMIAAALLLSSCSDDEKVRKTDGLQDPEEIRVNMPADMKNCKVYRVFAEGGGVFIITRCPNADVNTRYGKYGDTKTVDETPVECDAEGTQDEKTP